MPRNHDPDKGLTELSNVQLWRYMLLTDLVLPCLTNFMTFFLSDFATLEGYEPSISVIKYLLKEVITWVAVLFRLLLLFSDKNTGQKTLCSPDFRGRDHILPSAYRSKVTYLVCVKSYQPEIALDLAVCRKRFSLILRYCEKQGTEK